MSVLGHADYSVAIARSEEHAVAQTTRHPPFLIILAGDHHTWSRHLLSRLRTCADACLITLVALTDFHAPSWVPQEDNPGFDGFLVNPISTDVLYSLVQAAYMRQTCYSKSCPVCLTDRTEPMTPHFL